MSDTTKREWITPQLIVLGRGRPEESVLANCKTGELPAPGPSSNACTQSQIQCRTSAAS